MFTFNQTTFGGESQKKSEQQGDVDMGRGYGSPEELANIGSSPEGLLDFFPVTGLYDAGYPARAALGEAAAQRHRAWRQSQVMQARLQRVNHDMRIAREIQFRLFPSSPPDFPGFDIAGATYPAEMVDGDYFDYIHLPDETLALVVADAC